MSTGGNLTLGRLLRTKGVTTNPFFKHISGAKTDADWPLPDRKNAEIFRDCPGWYIFGAYPSTRIVDLDATDQSTSPFAGGGADIASGVRVRQQGPLNMESYQYPGGLVQRLKNGKALVGKKLKISGCYRVPTTAAALASGSGMSIWLKGAVHSMQVDPNYDTADTGSVTARNELTTSTFPAQVAGDILAVERRWLREPFTARVGGEGNGVVSGTGTVFSDAGALFTKDILLPAGVLPQAPIDTTYITIDGQGTFQVLTVTSATAITISGASDDTGLTWSVDQPVNSSIWQIATLPLDGPATVEGVGDWRVETLPPSCRFVVSAASDGEASFLGRRGIRMGTLNHVVGHVISWSSSATYGAGEEWLCRAWDYVEEPSYDTATTPSARVLCFRPYEAADDRAVTREGVGNIGIGYHGRGDPLSERYLQGIPPANSWVHYLDAEDWDNVAANGNTRLVNDLQTGVATTAQYFETIVDVPADFATSGGDDVFLVVMPVDPVEALATNWDETEVVFYALNIEIVPDPDNDEVDRLIESFYMQDDLPVLGHNVRDLIQYPIYVPKMIPLSVNWDHGDDGSTATYVMAKRVEDFVAEGRVRLEGHFARTTGATLGQSTKAILARQESLPPLSVVVQASFWIHESDLLVIDNGTPSATTPNEYALPFELVGVQHRFPSGATGPGDEQSRTGRIASCRGPAAAVASATEYPFTDGRRVNVIADPAARGGFYRHRVGLSWPGVRNDPISLSGQGSWETFLVFTGTNYGGAVLDASPGYMVVLVDPRAQNFFWSTS